MLILFSISNEDLIKYFNQAYSRKVEENPSNTYSYLTKDSIVISVHVPHAIGEHIEYKIVMRKCFPSVKLFWNYIQGIHIYGLKNNNIL